MGRKISIRCSGEDGHVNDVDLERILCPQQMLRSLNPACETSEIERLVLRCRHCANGKVVIDRAMIRRFQTEGRKEEPRNE